MFGSSRWKASFRGVDSMDRTFYWVDRRFYWEEMSFSRTVGRAGKPPSCASLRRTGGQESAVSAHGTARQFPGGLACKIGRAGKSLSDRQSYQAALLGGRAALPGGPKKSIYSVRLG